MGQFVTRPFRISALLGNSNVDDTLIDFSWKAQHDQTTINELANNMLCKGLSYFYTEMKPLLEKNPVEWKPVANQKAFENQFCNVLKTKLSLEEQYIKFPLYPVNKEDPLVTIFDNEGNHYIAKESTAFVLGPNSPDTRVLRKYLRDGSHYIGGILRSKYHDRGILFTPSNTNDGCIYIGEWKNGKRDGFGYMGTPEQTYCGQWKNDTPHGMGTLFNTKDIVSSKLVSSALDHQLGVNYIPTILMNFMIISYPQQYKGIYTYHIRIFNWLHSIDKDEQIHESLDNFIDAGKKFVYKGEWRNGRRHGNGVGWIHRFAATCNKKTSNNECIGSYQSTKFIGEWKDNAPCNGTVFISPHELRDRDGHTVVDGLQFSETDMIAANGKIQHSCFVGEYTLYVFPKFELEKDLDIQFEHDAIKSVTVGDHLFLVKDKVSIPSARKQIVRSRGQGLSALKQGTIIHVHGNGSFDVYIDHKRYWKSDMFDKRSVMKQGQCIIVDESGQEVWDGGDPSIYFLDDGLSANDFQVGDKVAVLQLFSNSPIISLIEQGQVTTHDTLHDDQSYHPGIIVEHLGKDKDYTNIVEKHKRFFQLPR